MSNFRNWLQNENGEFPQLGSPIDNGQTPASSEVKRTGLQPQVDAQEIETKSKAEQDKISAIDAEIERIQEILGSVDDEKHPKLGHFKSMWNELLDSWETIKFGDEPMDDGSGLGSHTPSERELDSMKQNQPLPRDQAPPGPGTFGNV